jgi:hypothetical protein
MVLTGEKPMDNPMVLLWIPAALLALFGVLLLLQWLLLTVLPVRGREAGSAPRASAAPVMSAPPPAPAYAPPPAYPPPGYSQPPAPVYAAPPQPAAPAMPPQPADGIARVSIIAGLPGQEFPLPGTMFFIGRFYAPDQNVLIALDEKSVSRRHAQLRANPATREFYLSDLGSSFGTQLITPDGATNRLQPSREERIYHGDIAQFGNSVRVRFLLPCESRSSVTQL